MSLVMTLYVREGIVMASDSRLTLNNTTQLQPELIQQPDQQVAIQQQVLRQVAVGQTDSTNKTFLARGRIGISTYGDADVQGVPISGYIESFINEKLPQDCKVDEVPQLLLDYFKEMVGPPDVAFFVAGYKEEEGKRVPYVYRVIVVQDHFYQVNPKGEPGSDLGTSWGGEQDILVRLLQPVYVDDNQGSFSAIENYGIPYGFFTLQDAIDFAIYGIRTTIDALRFQPRAKTVGGPIDVLVIKPEEAFWIQSKKLHGD